MAICLLRGIGSTALALVLLLGGCGKQTAKIDLLEIQDPLVRKARAKADGGDRVGALACFNQTLEKRPGLAQAHLEAALLYDDFSKDYVRAIYHYQRYLELRPGTDKKAMIEEMIRKARLSFAASVSDQLPGFTEKLRTLQEENVRLKDDLRTLRENAAQRGGSSAGIAATAKEKKPLAPAATAAIQVYRVQEHETLSMIAAKLYRNPAKWKVIFEANRKTLASPQKLRPGQTLIIPPLSSTPSIQETP